MKKVKLYIQAIKWLTFRGEGFEVSVSNKKQNSTEHLLVVDLDEVEIEIEVPNINGNDATLVEIESIKDAIKKEKADSEMRVFLLDERVQSLMAINCKGDTNE